MLCRWTLPVLRGRSLTPRHEARGGHSEVITWLEKRLSRRSGNSWCPSRKSPSGSHLKFSHSDGQPRVQQADPRTPGWKPTQPGLLAGLDQQTISSLKKPFWNSAKCISAKESQSKKRADHSGTHFVCRHRVDRQFVVLQVRRRFAAR